MLLYFCQAIVENGSTSQLPYLYMAEGHVSRVRIIGAKQAYLT
jgi:hypothetical protein